MFRCDKPLSRRRGNPLRKDTTVTMVSDHKVKRTIWALGDYAEVASQLIPELGRVLVDAGGVGPGERVLDVAAGAGNVAIPAALTGAKVVASDMTPDLLETGRQHAEKQTAPSWSGARPTPRICRSATASSTRCCRASGSCSPLTTRPSADELVRVCRPGGTIGLVSWTREGFIGQMFATMKPYAPAPPPGAQPPPLWGREEHVRELFGDQGHRRRAPGPERLRVEQFGQARTSATTSSATTARPSRSS